MIMAGFSFTFSSIAEKYLLTLLHSERPKLYVILVFLSAIGLTNSPSPRLITLSYSLYTGRFLGRQKLLLGI